MISNRCTTNLTSELSSDTSVPVVDLLAALMLIEFFIVLPVGSFMFALVLVLDVVFEVTSTVLVVSMVIFLVLGFHLA